MEGIKKFIKNWVIPLLIAFVIAKLVNEFLIFRVSIPSESMMPTIDKGDQLIAKKIYNTNKIKRGDIIIFWSKELDTMVIKRVIGLPGDEIDISNGTVNVNGENLIESYVEDDINYSGKFYVPEESFFFLGDNRGNSKDSRLWKNPYIYKDDIKGEPLFRCYPFDKVGPIK